MKHRRWIAFSGVLWCVMGAWLLFKGLRFVSEAVFHVDSLYFQWQDMFASPQQTGMAWIALGLFLGFLKGRWILAKTVRKVSLRILSLPLPIRLAALYTPSYWRLLGSMLGIGMVLRFIPIPLEIKGFVDIAIGSALLNGAMLYFRAARGGLRI